MMITALTISLAMMVSDPQQNHNTPHSSSNPYSSSLVLEPQYKPRLGPRPSKWCGWYMRQYLGVQDNRYNLARSWYTWGRATGPTLGAVVVWPHHVGIIVGKNSKGQWLIRSGNDGGTVKTRVWNLRNAKFRIA